ncbi:MAG TPA: hypothetical protein VNW06_09670 [Cytophagaceae bacterium]|jgi:hypothetical protein|nr:hypothetical protein [Cytophagaceae bacterium]
MNKINWDKLIQKEIEDGVNELVADLASCDHFGCRCWQAQKYLEDISKYCLSQLNKSDL